MSYQALARQFRPQDFTELVGQEHVSQALINGLNQNRLHHAFLFTGTRGVGKTTVARILAKALNCETGITGSPCGKCNACEEITEGRFVDLIEVDAASRTGVDDTRELLENVQYAPTKGRYKIYLIDEVHMFSNSSFNALLKTLEEPPPHVKFLLATTEPKKLPVTVLSRCLQFNLKRLSLKHINDHLIKLAKLQNAEYDNTAIEMIARAADGSMRDGLSLLDQSLAFGAGTVKDNDVKLMLGTMDQDKVVNLLLSIMANNQDEINNQLQLINEMAPDYKRLLDDMAFLLHQVSLFQILNNHVDNSQFSRTDINAIVSKTNPEQTQLYYQIVIKGQSDIILAPDSKTGFEMTIMRLMAFKIGSPNGGINNNQQAIGSNSSQKQNTVIDRKTENQVASNIEVKPSVSVEPTKTYKLSEINQQNWDEIFANMPLKGTSRELARNAQIVGVENGVLIVAIDKQAHMFMTDNAQNKLLKAIENITSEPIKVQLQKEAVSVDTIAKKQHQKQQNTILETKEKVNQNPFVQHMQENFDAQVIQIKKGESFI